MSILKRSSNILSVIALVVSCIALGINIKVNQELHETLRQLQAVEDQIGAQLHDTLPKSTVFQLYDCSQPRQTLVVEKGGSVWGVISDHVWKNHPGETASQHEGHVLRLVAFMQNQIDLTPEQAVRHLGRVPVGYMFAMTADDGIFLPGE